MKKLLFILLVFVLFSCDNTEIEVKNPEKITTIEIQQMAAQDTVMYKKVYLNDVLYLVNRDNQVEYKITNYSGSFGTTMILIIILAIVCMILWSFID